MASTARSTLLHAVITITGSNGSAGLHLRQQLKALLAGGCVAGVIQIHDRRIVVAIFNGLDHLAGRFDRLDSVPFALQQQPQRLQHIRLIVGDQDAHLRGYDFHGRLTAKRRAVPEVRRRDADCPETR